MAGNRVKKEAVISWEGTLEPDLAGYRLFVGTVPGAYGPPQTILVPSTSISCAEAGIISDGQYYITVTAYDTAGNESEKATELPFEMDTIAPFTPTGLVVF